MSPDQLVPLATLVAIGLAAGFLSGLLGVGGGILLVPALVLLLGYEQHIAQGTSLLVIIPAALTGSLTHFRHGRLQLRDAGFLALGGALGAGLGSFLALSIEGLVLRRLFAGLLALIALRMLLPRLRSGRRSDAGDVEL